MYQWTVLMYQWTVLSWLLITITPAMAQTVEYPVQPSKTPEAKSAGIGSYRLTQDGEIIEAEAFDLEGRPLADCKASWPEDTQVMTCTILPDGERFRATWYSKRVEFENLDSGDHFSLYKEGPSLREIAAMEPEERPERDGWVLRGTKTWEEVERDWGHITPIFGNLSGEIKLTLGTRAE